MRVVQTLLLFLIISIESLVAQPTQSPMMYEFPYLCPSCNEDMVLSLRVAEDGTSILETHEISTTPIIDPEYDDSEYQPGELIVGPLTNGEVGVVQNWDDEIGTNFIEIREDRFPEEGVRYVDEELTKASEEPGSSSWSINNLSVSVENTGQQETVRGFNSNHFIGDVEYTQTNYDSGGSETSNTDVSYELHLWLSEELSFSPLPFQYEPFKENRIPPYNFAPIDDIVVKRMLEQIVGKGGLVRSQLIFEGEEYTVEIENVRETPALPKQKFETLPVVSASQVDHFAGPLFIISLLRDSDLAEMGSGNITFDGREIPASSVWKVNEAGDLVIVVTAKEENTTFFLVRPLNGRPDEGSFDVKNRPDGKMLRAMSGEELSQHSNHFQIYGLVSGDQFPTVISGFESGNVMITSSEGASISGESTGSVSALDTNQPTDPETVPLEISFTSEKGLEDFQFRSPESRYAGR
ncbi:MAG: hypothetical protein GVY20_09705 [Bacteroidetes bacterium]|jgi:hypothetical protein|nr:hypothetical protein [Bacteroidota bacterium]